MRDRKVDKRNCVYQTKKETGMKQFYEEPNVILIVLDQTDIVRTSPGDGYEEDDFPAFGG